MEALLNFFSNLILFTGGLIVAFCWIVIIIVGSVELWDAIFEKKTDNESEEDDA